MPSISVASVIIIIIIIMIMIMIIANDYNNHGNNMLSSIHKIMPLIQSQ